MMNVNPVMPHMPIISLCGELGTSRIKVPSATSGGHYYEVTQFPSNPICNCPFFNAVSNKLKTCQHIQRVKEEATIQVPHRGVLTYSKDKEMVSYKTAPDFKGRWFDTKDIVSDDGESITVPAWYLDRHTILKGVAK